MKKLIGLLSLLATLFSASAQTTVPANVKGTPYLDDAYVNAEIAFANNTRTAPVRYNALKDLMEYQQNGQALVLDPTTTIKHVNLNGEKFVVEKYESDGRVIPGYFSVLETGVLTLYSKKEVRFVPARKGGAMDGSDQPAEFKRTPDSYYFKIGEGNLQEIKNLKSLIAALPDKQDEMSQYVKKEKISARDGEELRQLVKHYNDMRE